MHLEVLSLSGCSGGRLGRWKKDRKNVSKVTQLSQVQILCPRLMSLSPMCNNKVISLHSTETQQAGEESSASVGTGELCCSIS